MNDDNLKMFGTDQSREKAREAGRMGGIASGIAKRRKKTLLELVNIVGNASVPDEKKEQLKATFKDMINDEDYTYNAMVVLALYEKAIVEKDVRAMENVFDYSDKTQEQNDEYSDLSIEELRGLLRGNKSENTPKT